MSLKPATAQDITREAMTFATTPVCPGIYYAFGASYPDGICHDGHLDDADSDECSETSHYLPCPHCSSADYQEAIADGGEITPPFGYDKLLFGDFFAPRDRAMFDRLIADEVHAA